MQNVGDCGKLDAVTIDRVANSIARVEEFLKLAESSIDTLPLPYLRAIES
ncbi:MAG: hypothetical protein ACRC62_06635 [Microcoleus sp.]